MLSSFFVMLMSSLAHPCGQNDNAILNFNGAARFPAGMFPCFLVPSRQAPVLLGAVSAHFPTKIPTARRQCARVRHQMKRQKSQLSALVRLGPPQISGKARLPIGSVVIVATWLMQLASIHRPPPHSARGRRAKAHSLSAPAWPLRERANGRQLFALFELP